MKCTILVLGLLIISSTQSISQDNKIEETAPKDEAYWKSWINDLYEVGVDKKNDSLIISDDVKKIIKEPEYREIIYPNEYTIPLAGNLMKKMEIKKAMWYLINVYTKEKNNRQMVMNIILPFEKGLEMDKVLISTFYTYVMTDPEVGSISNGKIQIDHPDIMEQKFNAVKQMSAYIVSKRKEPNDNAAKTLGENKNQELKNLKERRINKIIEP